MAYTAEISRANPTCFLFLIDQSGSMDEIIDPSNIQPMKEPMVMDGKTYTHTAQGRTKAQGLADAINSFLKNLAIICAKPEGVRDYFHVGVFCYGGIVGPALGGSLKGKELVPISEVADNPARIEERKKKVEDGAGGLAEETIKFPIWIDPVANGATPMCEALMHAQRIIQDWLNRHPDCFPPIVIHITDGEATDGDPSIPAESIKQLSSSDGNILLFNLHFAPHQAASLIIFPDSEAGLPNDEFARRLFRMSSTLTQNMLNAAKGEGYPVSENSRGYGFNADMVALINFLGIGTRTSSLR